MKAAMVTERAQAEEELGKARAQARLEEVWIPVALESLGPIWS